MTAKTANQPVEKKQDHKIRLILVAVAIIAIGLLLYTNRATLGETWDLLLTLDWRIVAIIPLLQLTSYAFLALYYRSFFHALGHKLPYKLSYQSTAALAFVNQILPSGGLSGISYLGYAWRKIAPLGVTTMIQISRYILSLGAYVIVLIIASTSLWASNDVHGDVGFVMLVLLGFTLLVGTFLFLALKNRTKTDQIIGWITDKVNVFIRWLRRKPNSYKLVAEKSLRRTLDDFHDRILLVSKERKRLIKPWLWILMSTIFENAIVYTAFLAVGVTLNPGIVILAFAAANVAGVISIIPGDVGVHELVMVFVLSSFGVDSAVALSATLLYRVFNKMIILPIGFYFYSHVLKPAEAAGRV